MKLGCRQHVHAYSLDVRAINCKLVEAEANEDGAAVRNDRLKQNYSIWAVN